MIRVERSALLPFTPVQLLALVQDVSRYPEYLPSCTAARVLLDAGERVEAELAFRFAGITERFKTENSVQRGNDQSLALQMRLLQGPFKSLDGLWRFQTLGDAACKVSLSIAVDLGGWTLARLLSPQLDRTVGQVMDAFRKRAEALYGAAGPV